MTAPSSRALRNTCRDYAAATAKVDEVAALGDEKGRRALEGVRNDEPRLRIDLNWEGLSRSPNDDLRDHCDQRDQQCGCRGT
jgi:hypothetical protein